MPKFFSQLIFFFLQYEGTLLIKVTGERRFSFDLPQGGMEIPADFVFKTVDAKLHNQMREKVLKELENFEGRRKVGIDKSLKKNEKKKNKTSTKKCVFNFSTPNLIRFDSYFTLTISTTINFNFQGIFFSSYY